MEKTSSSPQSTPSSTVSSENAIAFEKEAGNEAMQKVAQEVLVTQLAPSLLQENGQINLSAGQESQDATFQRVQRAVSMPLPVVSGPQSNRSQLQAVSFATTTRYLPNLPELVATQGRDREIALLCSDIRQGKWLDIIARYKAQGSDIDNLSFDALKAFRDEVLSAEQFSTATFCWALLVEFPGMQVRIQPLFDGEENIYPAASNAMMQGLYAFTPSGENPLPNIFGYEEAQEVHRRFFENMRLKLPSEQFFFYIDLPNSENAASSEITLGDFLRKEIGVSIFDQFTLGHEHFQMVPSFSMIQAVVDAYGQDNAIAVCPTIGLSTEEDLCRNARESGRDLFLPFPGIPFPKVADGTPAPDVLQFLRHDIYHCLAISQVPRMCRIETARILQQIALLKERCKEADPFTQLFLETLYECVIDMEFPGFRPNSRQNCPQTADLTDIELFLIELQSQADQNVFGKMWSEVQSNPLEKWNPIRPANLSQFREAFRAFCSTTTLFKEWAEKMVQDGIFERFLLDTSFNNFTLLAERAEFFAQPFALPENANLFLQLGMAHQEAKRRKEKE